MDFNLKRPCANCPFRREGAIELMPGRLNSIIEGLRKNDHDVFLCHKTVYRKRRTMRRDRVQPSACAGALAYMYREGRLPVPARLAIHYGWLSPDDLKSNLADIIDPLPTRTRKSR